MKAYSDGEMEGIVLAIGDRINAMLKESGCTGAVMGVSGGIDSALVLTLAVRAGINVHGLIMPFTALNTFDNQDALRLLTFLNVEYGVYDIEPIYDKILGIYNLPVPVLENNAKITKGNVKARIRMILNYYFANSQNRIVLGTGNKTEIMLGYGTKYGDDGVDIQPIGDLYKTQVRQLAKYVGVPERILQKAPSAGLWEGQTDEGEIGATYEQMDAVLEYIEKVDRAVYYMADKTPKTLEEISEQTNVPVEVVERLLSMYAKSAHKRKAVPIIRIPV